jgi:DNA-directed RNA polymerase specialized sigma24 family protein
MRSPENEAELKGYFEGEYGRWRVGLAVYLEKQFGIRDQDAADIVQETFCRFWTTLSAGGWDRSLSSKSWLFRVACNLSIDLIRHRPTWPPPAPDAGQAEKPWANIEDSKAESPAQCLQETEDGAKMSAKTSEVVEQHLAGLHQLVVRTYLDIWPCTTEELRRAVSAKAGVEFTRGQIKGALQYGLQKLRKKLQYADETN